MQLGRDFWEPASPFNPLFADMARRLLKEKKNSERLSFLGPTFNI